MTLYKCTLLVALFTSCAGFVPSTPAARHVTLEAKKKGFGSDKFSEKKPKTAAKLEKERAASAYDAAKASGIPEYRVYVKVKGNEDWAPVGCVTVPRSESVSQSIYGNQEALVSAATAAYPGLKSQELEFGYNLAVFPDEPVKAAVAEDAARSTNPFFKFAKDLTNPLNANA